MNEVDQLCGMMWRLGETQLGVADNSFGLRCPRYLSPRASSPTNLSCLLFVMETITSDLGSHLATTSLSKVSPPTVESASWNLVSFAFIPASSQRDSRPGKKNNNKIVTTTPASCTCRESPIVSISQGIEDLFNTGSAIVYLPSSLTCVLAPSVADILIAFITAEPPPLPSLYPFPISFLPLPWFDISFPHPLSFGAQNLDKDAEGRYFTSR